MAILLRLTRVVIATVLAIAVFASLFEFLNAAPHLMGRNAGPSALLKSSFGALFWGLVFRAPAYLWSGAVPLVVAHAVLESGSIRKWVVYVLLANVAGFLAVGTSAPTATFLSAVSASALYWFLAGRTAGSMPALNWLRQYKWAYRAASLASYVLIAFVAFRLLAYGLFGMKLLWVSYVREPEAGVPPFRTTVGRELTAHQKVALLNFPDAESCLRAEAKQTADHLQAMDWALIYTTEEAEVCVFRLLASYGDADKAGDWFGAQGFKTNDRADRAISRMRRNSVRQVTASYSIRKHGPKFPTHAPLIRAFYSRAYGMGVNSTWSKDGKTLLEVRFNFSSL
jgi:hypothetical protein